jgi:membrane protein
MMKRTIDRIYKKAASGEMPFSNTPWARLLLDVVHMVVIVTQQTVRDRIPVRAATLSYWSAVGAVPLLVLSFALAGPLGVKDATIESVRNLLYDTVLSEAVGVEIISIIEGMLNQVDLETVGWIGVFGLMVIASQIYFQVELAFNDIFATPLKRSWFWRFSLFNLSVVIGPLLVAGGILLTAWLPEDTTGVSLVVPWLMTSLAFTIAIKYLPNTPVRWRSAIIGGVISAALFEAAKSGFTLYTDLLGTRDSMTRLYGSVAFVPVFLIWLNVVWTVVLMGVELAYVVDKRSVLLEVQRERTSDPHAWRRRPDGLFAVGVLLALYDATLDGPAGVGRIADLAGVPRHHTQDALEVLEDAGVVHRPNPRKWLPAHPPENITAGEVLRAWQSLAAPRWLHTDPSGRLVTQMQLRLEHSADTSMSKLAEEVRG